LTPDIMRGGDELAERRGLLPPIHFHDLKYRPAGRGTAIRCSPHAELDEFLAPWNNRLVSWACLVEFTSVGLGVRRRSYYSTGQAPNYRTMTSGGRTTTSGTRTTTAGGPTTTAS
jgi:hypothetical protein